MSAREEILARVRRAGGTGPRAALVRIPDGPVTSWEQRAARFTTRAQAAAATVARVAATDGVAGAVAEYLSGLNLPLIVHVSAGPPGLAPGNAGRLQFESGRVRLDGDTLVSGCLAAVADEGVIVMASGAGHAAESAFLAATHVVVVHARQMVNSLADLWPRVRAAGVPPRMINLILGPSRTADLGVPSRLGAHGPLRVHVILVGSP